MFRFLPAPWSEPQPIPEAVIGGSQGAEGASQGTSAWEWVVRQAGEGVKTFGLSTQCFGEGFSGDVREGHTVAATALRIVDVASDPPHLR